jgi:nucleotide-binding universal stress UspA family protein
VSEIKDIVAFTDARSESTRALELGVQLAEPWGAHLTGTFICSPLIVDAVLPGSVMAQLLDAYDADVRERERESRASFERITKRGTAPAEWRSVRHAFGEDLLVHTRYADLAIITRGDAEGRVAPPLGSPEKLVMGSGRPVIVVPPSELPARVGRRILVGWNASREAARACNDALPLLSRAEQVCLAVVDPERDGHGPEAGADIALHLSRHGVRVEVQRLASGGEDVGRVLLWKAASFEADLVVMGAYGHSRLAEFVFGGVTRTMLREAKLPILMSR